VPQNNGIRIPERAQFYNLSVLLQSSLGKFYREYAPWHIVHRMTPIQNADCGSSVATGQQPQPQLASMQVGRSFSEWDGGNPRISELRRRQSQVMHFGHAAQEQIQNGRA